MKKTITAFLFLFSGLLAMAQTGSNPTKSDVEAKKILDAVSSRFRSFASPQASFTYQVENAQGKALSTKRGTVVMKGNKFRVSMDGMEIFSDGKTVWNYDKSSNEVTVNNLNESGSGMTPQRVFTNFYDKDFFYKLNGTKKVGAKTVQEIELTPMDKTRPYHKVYVWVDKGARNIYSARFLEKSGGRYSYTINSIKPTSTLADAEFVFNRNKYPGVEVVDLR